MKSMKNVKDPGSQACGRRGSESPLPRPFMIFMSFTVKRRHQPTTAERGFTLLELMLALALGILASTMVVVTFAVVVKAWRTGAGLTDDLHHGDFVMDQLVSGLRSAYYPDASGRILEYGFWIEDQGSGEFARDSISWVKLGAALAEEASAAVAGPHRTKFSIEENDDMQAGAAVRFWRPYSQPEDFDPSEIPPQFISSRVTGFNCRVATNMLDGEWAWEDVWEEESTNRLPRAVELTLFLHPLDDRGEPVEMRRFVELPVSHLSWK